MKSDLADNAIVGAEKDLRLLLRLILLCNAALTSDLDFQGQTPKPLLEGRASQNPQKTLGHVNSYSRVLLKNLNSGESGLMQAQGCMRTPYPPLQP